MLIVIARTGMSLVYGKSAAAEIKTDLLTENLRLPFLLHNNCVLGLAAGAYFAQILPNLTPTSVQKEAALEATAPTFEWAVDYKGDVKKGFKLWDAVSSLFALLPISTYTGLLIIENRSTKACKLPLLHSNRRHFSKKPTNGLHPFVE
jgi:hypothetical protein